MLRTHTLRGFNISRNKTKKHQQKMTKNLVVIQSPYKPRANYYDAQFHDHSAIERFDWVHAMCGPSDAGCYLPGEVLEKYKSAGYSYVVMTAHSFSMQQNSFGIPIDPSTVRRGLDDAMMAINLVNADNYLAVANQTQYTLHNPTDSEAGWHFCYIYPLYPITRIYADFGCDTTPGTIIGTHNGVNNYVWNEGTDFIGTTTYGTGFNYVNRYRYQITLNFLDPNNLPDAGTYFIVRYIIDQSRRDLSGILWSYSTENVSLCITGNTYPCDPKTHINAIGDQTDWDGVEQTATWSVEEYIQHIESIGCLAQVNHPGEPSTFHTPEQLAECTFDLYEVYNARDWSELWDGLLQILIPQGLKYPFCTATDDLSCGGGAVAHTTIMADTLTKADLLANLKAGNGYASAGPISHTHFTPITVEGNEITIGTTHVGSPTPVSYDYHWFTSAGEVQTTLGVTQDTYTADGSEMYVRLYVEGPVSRKAWTNPFIVKTFPVDETEEIVATSSINESITVPIGWNT